MMPPGGGDDQNLMSLSSGKTVVEDEKEREICRERLHKRIGEGDEPLKIAIIGTHGSGKSSFCNTVMTAFSQDCWREWALAGNFGGEGKQVTFSLQRFIKEEYLTSCRDIQKYNYPVIIDMNGFENVNDKLTQELLRYVFYGLIPNEHKLIDAVKVFNEKGIEGMKEKYTSNEELLKVDRIIFVASSKSGLPRSLMEAVYTTARREDRVIPIFGVLTHQDKVDKNTVEFTQLENDFKTCLGLNENRYLLCTNYCDDFDKDVGISRLDSTHPALDTPILKFMRQVCDPVIKVLRDSSNIRGEVENVGAASIPKEQPAQTPVQDTPEKDDELSFQSIITFAVKGLLIAILLYWFLTPQIDGRQLADACSKYGQHSKQHNFSIPELQSLCDKLAEVSQRQLMMPLLCFVLAIIGTDFVLPQILRKIPGLDQR